jgi:hypothetical protein
MPAQAAEGRGTTEVDGTQYNSHGRNEIMQPILLLHQFVRFSAYRTEIGLNGLFQDAALFAD